MIFPLAYRESDVATEESTAPESKPSYFSTELKVRTDFINNIYGSFQCVPSQELCGMSGELMFLIYTYILYCFLFDNSC